MEEAVWDFFSKLKKCEPVTKAGRICAPVNGTVKCLESVNDGMFSEKIMGDGIVVIPSDGNFYSPVTGILESVFPTGHAYGIRTEAGEEILIHIGLDTVELKGNGFQAHVKQGQKIHMGDPLATVDLEKVKASGYSTATMVIVTSGQAILSRARENMDIHAREPLMELA